MAILIDYSQFILTPILATYAQTKSNDFLEPHTLERVLGKFLKNKLSKYKEYGNEVIACVDYGSWRYDVFKHYKASRKHARSKSDGLDYDLMFKSVKDIKLHNVFYLKVYKAEGDDCVAVAAKYIKNKNPNEKILLLSNDKDFKQLHGTYIDEQRSLKAGDELIDSDFSLIDHILNGDVSDGIPNILSDDNHFVDRLTSKRFTAKLKESLKNSQDLESNANFIRNRTLIDFNYIPEYIVESIYNKLDSYYNRIPYYDKFKFIEL